MSVPAAAPERKWFDEECSDERALLDCGADVVVVSPSVTAGLDRLIEDGSIRHRRREFLRSDVRGCALVIAATAVATVDTAVAAAARRVRALINVVDRPAQCDFIFPSVLRRGELQVAISTGGRSPALAREIRRRLERVFGPEYAELFRRVGEARTRARAKAETGQARIAAGEQAAALELAWHPDWRHEPLNLLLPQRECLHIQLGSTDGTSAELLPRLQDDEGARGGSLLA